MTRKQRRFSLIAICGVVLGAAVALILVALNQNITFFRSPSDIVKLDLKPGTHMRIGGLVEGGTLVKNEGEQVRFAVTDGDRSLKVAYHGLLPDLFREGQGVVAEGTLQLDGSFIADTVLAKHDERYMPREVVDALKKQGRWQEGAAGTPGAPLIGELKQR